jgi:nucleotide-binding universal stress UspA family protein
MKILVASDGSKPALHVVRYASNLLRMLSPASHSITLVSVHDDAGLRHARAFVGRDAVASYLRELSDKELKPAIRLLDASGFPYHVEMRTGHVAQEILACAAKGRFDLLVLGAKGRAALSDLLLGSVAQRLLASAKVPVLLVR